MIKLKTTDFVMLKLSLGDTLDCQIRQYENEKRMIYLGQNSNVIQFPEDDIPELIKFLEKAKKLEFTEARERWLK